MSEAERPPVAPAEITLSPEARNEVASALVAFHDSTYQFADRTARSIRSAVEGRSMGPDDIEIAIQNALNDMSKRWYDWVTRSLLSMTPDETLRARRDLGLEEIPE